MHITMTPITANEAPRQPLRVGISPFINRARGKVNKVQNQMKKYVLSWRIRINTPYAHYNDTHHCQ